MSARPWTYEPIAERRKRELDEFDALTAGAVDASASPEPLATTRASQAFAEVKNRDANQQVKYDLRERVRAAAERKRVEQDQNILGKIFEPIDRVRHAGIGFFSGDNPVESVQQAIGGIRGEKYSGEDLPFVRLLPEGSRARAAGGRVAEEIVDPLNWLIAVKGPVLASKITGKGVASKAARMLLEPIASSRRGIPTRAAAEIGAATVARFTGEAAMEALPEDMNPVAKGVIGLGAGVLGAGTSAATAGAFMRGVERGALDISRSRAFDELARENFINRAAATEAERRVPRVAGASDDPVQGGLEGIGRDQPTFRPENRPDETQMEMGIGSGERPIEDLPMFRQEPTETGVVRQHEALTSDFVDSDAIPSVDSLNARIKQLEDSLPRRDGRVLRNRQSEQQMQQIGELRAAKSIRAAFDESGGDPFNALSILEERWREVSEALTVRESRASYGRTDAGRAALREAAQYGEIGSLRAEASALDTFMETAAVDVRTSEPDVRAFAERYGVDPEVKAKNREEEFAERVVRAAEDAGIRVADNQIARVIAGDRRALRDLQNRINQSRRQAGKPPIRLRETVEAGRERGVVRRIPAEEAIRSADLGDPAIARGLMEQLRIEPTAAMQKRIDAGQRLTVSQQNRLRNQIMPMIERIAPDDRVRLMRDVGVEPEPAVRPGSEDAADTLEAAGYTERAGLLLPPGGTAIEQARAILPEDSYALRLADEARTGDVPAIAGRLTGGSGPPRPPRYQYRAPAGPEPLPRGIDRALRFTESELQEAGGITRLIDSLAARVPGGERGVRALRAAINPSLNHVRRVLVAYNAEGKTVAELGSEWKARKLGMTRQIEAAWDAEAPRYIGPDDNPYRGMIADYLENPAWYEGSDALAASARALHDADLDMIRVAKEDFGVDIEPYVFKDPDAVYIPHVPKNTGAVEGNEIARTQLVSTSRAKARAYETLYDRWAAAKKRGETVDLETSMDVLQMHHAEAMARMAGDQVFKTGTGGINRATLMERVRPGLAQRKNIQRTRIRNLDARLKTAMREGRVAARDTRTIAGKMTKQERRAQPFIERVEKLGYEGGTARTSEWGPELSHLAGQLREVGLQWRHLRAELIRKGERIADIEAKHRDLLRDYEDAAQRLERLTKRYDRPVSAEEWNRIGGEYAESTRTRMWHPRQEAATIDGLYKSMGDLPGLRHVQPAFEHWRGFVTSLDATFLTIHGAFASMMDPRLTVQSARKMVDAFKTDDFMLRIAQDEPELVKEFARSSGFEWPIAGREATGGELARNRGMEAIQFKGFGSKVRDFNDRQWRMVTYRLFEQWKKDRAILMEYGVTPNVAGAEAAHVAFSIVPRMNIRATGRSQMHAEFERMMVISPSFLFQPAVAAKDFSSGIVKMASAKAGLGNESWAALLPRERLAVKRYGVMMATMGSLAVGSAMLTAAFNGDDPIERGIEVLNPASGKFMAFTAGNAGTIPLGSAHRSFLRAFAPRRDGEGGMNWTAGMAQFFKGKRHPALSAALDQYAGEDFMGNNIEEGRLPIALGNRLWYAAETGMPIWVQPISAAGRGSPLAADSLVEGIIEAAFGTLGYSYYERSAFDELDRLSRTNYGAPYHELPPSQQVEIRERYPDVWAASIRDGREQRRQYQGQLATVNSYQQESDRMLFTGEVTREGWLNSYRQRMQMLAGYREAIFEQSPQTERNTPLDQYFEQIELSKGLDGLPDWEAIDEWKLSQSQEDQDYIDENTGVSRTVLARVYRGVSKQYVEYLSLPKYRGYDADQAREIDAAWQQVQNRASEIAEGRDVTRSYQIAALEELGPMVQALPADIRLGVELRILGRLKQVDDRERFRAAHPDIDLFYGRGPITELQRIRLAELSQQEMRESEDSVLRDLSEVMSPTMPAIQPKGVSAIRERIAAARAR